MAYDLNQFVADCRDILGRDPGPAGREQVRANLERLLANEEFIDECCGDAVSCGLKVLYEDPTLGFQILAHINDKARVSPPHDHGDSWAIYAKLALFLAIGVISVKPTMTFIRWRRMFERDAAWQVPAGEQAAMRRLVMVEAHLAAIIPFIAVMMSRGLGR